MLSRLRRIKTRYQIRRDDRVEIDERTVLRDDFRWDIREKPDKKPNIKIGKDCIIGGYFVIENSNASIAIGEATTLGSGSMIVAGDSNVIIGNHVIMSFGITIYTTNSHSFKVEERHKDLYNVLNYMRGKTNSRNINWSEIVSSDVIIEDDVWIGFGATILKGVRIGRGAIIGAKSVVTHNVEPFTVVAGNPAKIVKRINEASNDIKSVQEDE